jgi:hypothetical protein
MTRTCGLEAMPVADAFDALSRDESSPGVEYPAKYADGFWS